MHALMTCDLDICGDLKENVGGGAYNKDFEAPPEMLGACVPCGMCSDCRRTWLQSKSQVRSQQRY